MNGFLVTTVETKRSLVKRGGVPGVLYPCSPLLERGLQWCVRVSVCPCVSVSDLSMSVCPISACPVLDKNTDFSKNGDFPENPPGITSEEISFV